MVGWGDGWVVVSDTVVVIVNVWVSDGLIRMCRIGVPVDLLLRMSIIVKFEIVVVVVVFGHRGMLF